MSLKGYIVFAVLLILFATDMNYSMVGDDDSDSRGYGGGGSYGGSMSSGGHK